MAEDTEQSYSQHLEDSGHRLLDKAGSGYMDDTSYPIVLALQGIGELLKAILQELRKLNSNG